MILGPGTVEGDGFESLAANDRTQHLRQGGVTKVARRAGGRVRHIATRLRAR